jgi:hypothetical protein
MRCGRTQLQQQYACHSRNDSRFRWFAPLDVPDASCGPGRHLKSSTISRSPLSLHREHNRTDPALLEVSTAIGHGG